LAPARAATTVQTCKNCKSPWSVSIVSKCGDTSYTAEDAEARRAKPVAVIECRGVTPAEAQAGPGWTVTGPSGATWPDVTLDDEWSEYDEKAEVSLTLLDAVMSVGPKR